MSKKIYMHEDYDVLKTKEFRPISIRFKTTLIMRYFSFRRNVFF